MNILEKMIKKNVQGMDDLSESELKKHSALCGHHYFAQLLVYKVIATKKIDIILFITSLIGLILILIDQSIGVCITCFFIMLVLYIPFTLEIVMIYKSRVKKQSDNEILEWLIDKIINICLLDYSVISARDWRKIKSFHEGWYKFIRSHQGNHMCYDTTFKMANILKNPDIKILWLCVGTEGDKYGHAVLVKKSRVYDTNLRRTYDLKKYLINFNAEIFKEYSIKDYSKFEEFDGLDWDYFADWCIERGASRNSNV